MPALEIERSPLTICVERLLQTAGPPAGTGSNETPTWPGSNMVDVKNVTPGNYKVRARKEGYAPKEAPVSASSNAPATKADMTW